MPYKDPARERERQRLRRENGHGAAYLEAATWADGQMALLKSMGITHTQEEWAEIRRDLAKSRLNSATRAALYTPAPS